MLGLTAGVLAGCRGTAPIGGGPATITLSSTSFREGAIAPAATCDGADRSPELHWSAPPAGTRSLALVVIDVSWPVNSFVHWLVYDLPAGTRELPDGVPTAGELPDGSRQGMNDFDQTGYRGPCPRSAHRYGFVLYALDARLGLPPEATRSQVEHALEHHVLAHGELIGRYQRARAK